MAKKDKWMQNAVDERDEGKFNDWCKRHGHDGVTQACIDEAAKEGGEAARMANFAVNSNPDKWTYTETNDKESLSYFDLNKYAKKKDWEYNPWAVCSENIDKEEETEKHERCVKKVKKKQKK